MDLLSDPAIVKALNELIDDAQDALTALDEETKRREMLEVLHDAIQLGLAAASIAAKRTSTRFDDIAVDALRYSGALDLIVASLTEPDSASET